MLEFKSDSFAIYRDDLFPFLGGGNKARKMMALDSEIKNKGYKAIVTTGGIQSNHCRVVALYCMRNNLECTLVLHGSKKDFYKQSGNAKIIKNTQFKLVFCTPDKISSLMETIFNEYVESNKNPFYIPGGGHIIKAAAAYLDVIKEIKDSEYIPDYIFVASGTGSTQAGILAGLTKYRLPSKLYGISVGRKKERGHPITENFYSQICQEYNIKPETQRVNFIDDYLCGGYGKCNSSIEAIERSSITDYNLFLDKTYSAKVFYAMKEVIKKESLKGKILFWYTGSVFNYLA